MVVMDYDIFYREGIMDTKSTNLGPTRCDDEMAVHKAILKYDNQDILKHPLSESFLHIKWQVAKHVPYANLLFILLFAIVLTSLAVYETHLVKCDSENIDASGK